jgi:hypothetical protein
VRVLLDLSLLDERAGRVQVEAVRRVDVDALPRTVGEANLAAVVDGSVGTGEGLDSAGALAFACVRSDRANRPPSGDESRPLR